MLYKCIVFTGNENPLSHFLSLSRPNFFAAPIWDSGSQSVHK